jgi:hypothetical protein
MEDVDRDLKAAKHAWEEATKQEQSKSVVLSREVLTFSSSRFAGQESLFLCKGGIRVSNISTRQLLPCVNLATYDDVDRATSQVEGYEEDFRFPNKGESCRLAEVRCALAEAGNNCADISIVYGDVTSATEILNRGPPHFRDASHVVASLNDENARLTRELEDSRQRFMASAITNRLLSESKSKPHVT